MELKISGKNISRRSYHTSAIYKDYLYIYGGYDVNTGILNDFWRLNVNDPVDYVWENLTNLDDPNYPGPRERHQCFVYENKLYIFGGLKHTLENTN